MERSLHLCTGMIYKKALPIQGDINRYSDSGCAGAEQMLGLPEFYFRTLRRYWAHEKIIAGKALVATKPSF